MRGHPLNWLRLSSGLGRLHFELYNQASTEIWFLAFLFYIRNDSLQLLISGCGSNHSRKQLGVHSTWQTVESYFVAFWKGVTLPTTEKCWRPCIADCGSLPSPFLEGCHSWSLGFCSMLQEHQAARSSHTYVACPWAFAHAVVSVQNSVSLLVHLPIAYSSSLTWLTHHL